MDNKTHISEKDYGVLHNKLVQDVVDFFKEHGLPENLFCLNFAMDGIEYSVDHGSWHAASDSILSLYDDKKDCLYWRA